MLNGYKKKPIMIGIIILTRITKSETKRIEFLFELYEKYTAGMFAGEGKGKKKRK